MKKNTRWMAVGLAVVLTTAAYTAARQWNQPKETPVQVQNAENYFTWDNATVYFVMTDRFLDGNPENNNAYGRPQKDAWGLNTGTFHGGDVKGLTQKLTEGYFTDLGVNAIWVTAPYEQIHGWVGGGGAGDFAHYGYHGYYALDYTMIDRNMGTVEEFREFVDTAHSKGIRVVLDVVLNHVGYNTLQDMTEYEFGKMNGIDAAWTPKEGENWHSHHGQIDYQDEHAWASWWGAEWVRAGLPGYTPGGGTDITMTLAGLPDIKTEVKEATTLPPVLVNKWNKEKEAEYDPWRIPAAKELRTEVGMAPADYIVKWLGAWVNEFGIDGFRVDTAKHVEMERWKQLKEEASTALSTWRENNPQKPGSHWTEDFWMTGEVWGHGVRKSAYFDHGFDSIINFTFQGEQGGGPAYRPATMDKVFTDYANKINSDPKFNVLSYISQHDTRLYKRDQLIEGGTYLLLLPGGVEIFYGDETARPFGPPSSDPQQGTRSPMNWEAVNTEVLMHWQKLGQFRTRNTAVGAGTHTKLKDDPYTFSRIYEKDEVKNGVVVVVDAEGSTTVDVSSVFAEGTSVQNGYTKEQTKVKNGLVTLDGGTSGLLLIEQAQP